MLTLMVGSSERGASLRMMLSHKSGSNAWWGAGSVLQCVAFEIFELVDHEHELAGRRQL
jgi:hypothetical protein